ncbi:MAG: GNAT family N-acetyltransferase [Acidobacteriota bacterium]
MIGEVVHRDMTIADIPAGLALCRASHWNQLARDWELFLRLSPRGCRVATVDDAVVGTVTTVRYENRFSWIGMVLVNPAQRGRGIGTRLLVEALELLADMGSIRLDATPAGQVIYEKLNFLEEYRLSRMEIDGSQVRAQAQVSVTPMTADDFVEVLELDRAVFGADRRAVLESMIEGAPEYARVVRAQAGIEGYTFGRHGFRFEHIGPLVARDQQTARNLTLTCLAQHPMPFILDASDWPDWKQWLESVGFRVQRPFIRMYRGANPFAGRPDQQFAILGPEFG